MTRWLVLHSTRPKNWRDFEDRFSAICASKQQSSKVVFNRLAILVLATFWSFWLKQLSSRVWKWRPPSLNLSLSIWLWATFEKKCAQKCGLVVLEMSFQIMISIIWFGTILNLCLVHSILSTNFTYWTYVFLIFYHFWPRHSYKRLKFILLSLVWEYHRKINTNVLCW